MADPADNGNSEIKRRRVLAPLLWPREQDGPVFYLSWPGWELYLTRRLGLPENRFQGTSLMLESVDSPETDFMAIDQLAALAAEMGAGMLSLKQVARESVNGLAVAISNYGNGLNQSKSCPLLDDRSFLALWSLNEYRRQQTKEALNEAAHKEEAMWAALKGEEPAAAELDPVSKEAEPGPTPQSDYAWAAWRRLAGGLIRKEDIIVQAVPESIEDE